MATDFEQLYQEYVASLNGVLEGESYFDGFLQWIQKGKNTVALNRRKMHKKVDSVWVEEIERCLPAIDHFIRNPRKFIRDEEEVLPIEVSKNIGPKSIRHLAQHTGLIDRIDEDGTVTPSKILNVYKEESFDTYENKFINTLIDRLYTFFHLRYEKLKAAKEESVTRLEASSALNSPDGGQVTFRFELEARDVNDRQDEESAKLWERIEQMGRIIESYKRSPFAREMKGSYIRPPVMRTNAILKNAELKQCLNLWLYIEGYDKVGYEITATQTAETLDHQYVKEMNELSALQYLLFRRYTQTQAEILKSRRTTRPAAPKFVKNFQTELVEDYNIYEVETRKVLEVGQGKARHKLSEDELNIRKEIDLALASEKARKEAILAAEKEKERQRQERIREAERRRIQKEKELEKKEQEKRRRQELKRLAKEKEEQEKLRRAEERRQAAQRRQEELERRKRERLLQQQERQRLQEEKERRAIEKKRLAEEKQRAEEAAREEAYRRQRAEEEALKVRELQQKAEERIAARRKEQEQQYEQESRENWRKGGHRDFWNRK